jgi:competence protein ComEC
MDSPRSDGHAPLLWLAAPLVWGYVLARGLGDEVSPGLLVGLGLAVAVLALALTARERWFVRPAWGFLLMLAGTLLAWAYALVREPPPAPGQFFLPREAEVVLRIDRLFQSNPKFPRLGGFATVAAAPERQPELFGQPLAFSLWADQVNRSEVLPGSLLRARGKIARLDPAADLNDFQRYLVQSGYALQLEQGDALALEQPSGAFRRWCHRVNTRIANHLRAGADSPGKNALAGVATAMFLGDKAALGRQQKEAFIASGTMHLFAVSGLHVGIIAGAFALVLRRVLRVPPAPAAAVGLGLLFLYVQIIGAPPSALRAFLMVAFYWGAQLFRRKPAPVSALLASALTVLLIEPRQLFSAGFQLSYLVVAALLLYAAPLTEWANARLDPYRLIPAGSLSRAQRFIRKSLTVLNGSLVVSVTAFIFATPLTIAYFHVFAPGAILLNLILIPLATVVIVAALLSASVGLAGLGAACAGINAAAWALVWEMWTVVEAAVRLPGGFWEARFTAEWLPPAAALVLLGSLLVVARWARTRPAVFWLPPAILAPVLVFGVKFATLAAP